MPAKWTHCANVAGRNSGAGHVIGAVPRQYLVRTVIDAEAYFTAGTAGIAVHDDVTRIRRLLRGLIQAERVIWPVKLRPAGLPRSTQALVPLKFKAEVPLTPVVQAAPWMAPA